MRLWLLVCLAATSWHCSDSEFSENSNSQKRPADEQPRSNTPNKMASNDSDDLSNDTGPKGDVRSGLSEDATGALESQANEERTNPRNADNDQSILTEERSNPANNNIVLSGDDRQELARSCWFAVSGTYIGYTPLMARHGSTYPEPRTGGSIAHGETFDLVGGIYLQAREAPYIQGEGFIDKAIQYTFDAIMIAPGMKALVRDGSGNVILDESGPYIAGSDYYDRTNGTTHLDGWTRDMKSASHYPDWVRNYMQSLDKVPIVHLHPARSVVVKPIPGERCDIDWTSD